MGREGPSAGQRFLRHVGACEESFAVVLAGASAVVKTARRYWVAVPFLLDAIPL